MYLSQNHSYFVSINMKDTSKSVGDINDFTWTSSIYPPQDSGLNEYWVSTLDNLNNQ